MNIFFDEHRKLMADMLAEGVEFILVGGYAVNYHGYNRTTGDMDVWLKPDNANKSKFARALAKNDIDAEGLKTILSLDFTQILTFTAWETPHKIDFLTKVSGVTYDEANKEKIIADIEGVFVPFINLNHLILTKTATGRTQDKNDIEKLQEVQKKKNSL